MKDENKQSQMNKIKNRATSLILIIFVCCAVVISMINCFNMLSDISDKKAVLNQLQEEHDEAVILNNEYSYLLDEDNRLEYIERVAREQYGYVAPGERAFYDSSKGN